MLVCIHCGISYATYEKYPISCAKGEETYQHEFSPKEEFSKKCPGCGKEFKAASMDLADYMVGSHNATECEVGF